MVRSDEANAESPRFDSIEAVFHTLESPLLGYARRLLPDLDMAEDVVQEAFLKLYEQFRDVRDPRRWLYRTVHNLALNQRRSMRGMIPLSLKAEESGNPVAEATDPQPLPDEQIARQEGIGQLRLGLKTLDERSRELLRLKFQEDLSYKEIGARTGLKIGHVGYLLHHAIKSLATELERNGVTK